LGGGQREARGQRDGADQAAVKHRCPPWDSCSGFAGILTLLAVLSLCVGKVFQARRLLVFLGRSQQPVISDPVELVADAQRLDLPNADMLGPLRVRLGSAPVALLHGPRAR